MTKSAISFARVAAVGTPQQVAGRLAAFVAAGARHLNVVPASGGDPIAMARRVATDVMPLVVGAGGGG